MRNFPLTRPTALRILFTLLICLGMFMLPSAPLHAETDAPDAALTDQPHTVSPVEEIYLPQVQNLWPAPLPNFTGCDSVVGLPQEECEALVALFNATDGPNWLDNHNWLETDEPCGWNWIGCHSGHVVRLAIHANQLSGSIPPELSNLPKLQELLLNFNQLNGSIPAELGNLSELRTLGLGDNQLSGNLPSTLGNLTNLRNLWLVSNQLSGSIPPELGDLTELYQLHLSGNQLSGPIPPELGNLSGAWGIFIDNNQLSGSIPPELGNLTNLQVLSLYNNQLSGSVPPELGNLANLWGLSLDNNQLSGPLPLNLINLSLSTFTFAETNLCEPNDSAFHTWFAAILIRASTGIICGQE